MTKDINSAIDEFDGKFKNDMRVIGESVLTFDKLKKGIFKCRVNSNSSNPMINTLKNTINDALDDLENYMIVMVVKYLELMVVSIDVMMLNLLHPLRGVKRRTKVRSVLLIKTILVCPMIVVLMVLELEKLLILVK